MKIDIFAHILPSKYLEAVDRLRLINPDYVHGTTTLSDMEARFRIMDQYDDYVQVLTIPGFHRIITEGEARAVELAKLANDDLAELISRHPDRFVGGVASLPLNNMDAALKEADRAINELNFRGVEIWATNEKPLDMPEFMPVGGRQYKGDAPIH